MLSIDVRSLAAHPVTVDGTLAADDPVWMSEDARALTPLQISGRVSVAGPDRFYFSGQVAGSCAMECRRCLAPVVVEVRTELTAIFSDAGEEDADDPDVFALADGGRVVDLRPAIREQWLLSVPSFAECRPDCRGLCATCGTDLNTGACSCAPTTDSRWDALRAVRSDAN